MVVDCLPGDVIVTSIEGVGELVNTIFAPAGQLGALQRDAHLRAPQLGSEPNFVHGPSSPVGRRNESDTECDDEEGIRFFER